MTALSMHSAKYRAVFRREVTTLTGGWRSTGPAQYFDGLFTSAPFSTSERGGNDG